MSEQSWAGSPEFANQLAAQGEGASSGLSDARPVSDPWERIEAVTGWAIPASAKHGCIGPKLVTIPAGRALYAAGTAAKDTMHWGAFEELDAEWYLQGNQLDPNWYVCRPAERVAIYEYEVVLTEPTLAVMSKVADQSGAPGRKGPAKFQYYNPAGFGALVQRRLLGYLLPDGTLVPPEATA
jgi:hypothetical protein